MGTTTLLVDSTSTYDIVAVSPAQQQQQQQQQQRSPWNFPIPYMFGGLAAMLGLIAFALLILALEGVQGRGYGGESVPKKSSLDVEKPVRVSEQKVVVIMAGELRPTYIATPVYAKNVYCMANDNIDVVGKNAGQGGGCGGCTSDEEEKKDAPPLPWGHCFFSCFV